MIYVDGFRRKEAQFASLKALPFQCRCLGSPVVVVVARDGDVADLAAALRLRTRAPADLHHALEVNVHRVGELERLQKKKSFQAQLVEHLLVGLMVRGSMQAMSHGFESH